MRVLRVSLWVTFGIAVLVSLLAGAVLVWVLPEHVGSITIDGHQFTFDNLGARHWLLASGGVFVAMLVILLIVPLALIAAVVVPLAATSALTVLLMMAIVFVFVWPVLWLVKRLRR